MNPLIVLLVIRVGCLAAGILAIYFGYDLYHFATGSSDASLTLQNSASFWIRGAAPGVFFAALGTWIIVAVVTRPLQHKQTGGGDTPVETVVIGAGDQ